MTNRHSYYDIPQLPVQQHSVINEPHAREYGQRRDNKDDNDYEDDFELEEYFSNTKTGYTTITEPSSFYQTPHQQSPSKYDKPLLDDDGSGAYYYPSRSAPAPESFPQQQQQQAKQKNVLLEKLKVFPIFTCIFTIVDVSIFIFELVKMRQLTGSVIQTEPSFNPMLGPSSYVQIYLGSRFTPCAMSDQYVSLDYVWPCANSTTSDTDVCSLAELCQFANGTSPSQVWRIVSACFMHAGIIHIVFNMLLQCTVGREVEVEIGSLRYFVIYLLSGISGNLLGLNFAGDGVSSTGASGALFGIIAVNLVLYTLHKDKTKIRGYKIVLSVLIGEVVVCLVLGLLPGLDNFAHIGGFICGGLMAFITLSNPRFVKKNPSITHSLPWRTRHNSYKMKQFWIWTSVRGTSLALLIAWFVGLGINSKNGGGNCSWCKYLSCLPVNGWCDDMELTTS